MGYYAHFYFVTDTVDEALPDTIMNEGAKQETNVQTMPSQSITSQLPSSKGSFVEVDFVHKGYGDVSIMHTVEGKPFVRFENFRVTNGPDLYVYLSKSDNPRDDIGDFINLGRLKGNEGNQNYEIPQGVDVSEYKSVIIWCKAFSVLFSYALLY